MRLARLLRALGIAALVLAALAAGAARAEGAGVTLYRVEQGRTYLLLAAHRIASERGWAGFGGRLDGQAPAAAAAREGYEESKGLVSEHYLRVQIARSAPAMTNGFSAWFVELDWPGLAAALNDLPPPSGALAYRERGPYAWVALEAILAAIAAPDRSGRMALAAALLPPDAPNRHLFGYFVESLLRAREMGLIPEAGLGLDGPAG